LKTIELLSYIYKSIYVQRSKDTIFRIHGGISSIMTFLRKQKSFICKPVSRFVTTSLYMTVLPFI
jgi:hypothetical protein